MRYSLALFFLVFSSIQVLAGDFTDAFKNGKILLDIRYRVETVDQANLGKDAFASTVRTRVGFETAKFNNWTALMDFENITVVGDENYNNTKNGLGSRPVVADPEDTEVNRIQLTYSGIKDHTLIFGRQRIILDNARFIGNVGWRQNEQTYDGALWSMTKKRHTLSAAYLVNVNRIFGENHPNPLNANLRTSTFVAHYKLGKTPVGNLTFFGYFIDLDDLPNNSHQDLGVRLDGAWKLNDTLSFVHDLSYAKQDSYADGLDNIDADYYSLGWGPKWGKYTLTANYEVLGGDGTYGFATPLATLHAYNGWADQFLGTPASGLTDAFLKFVYVRQGWKVILMAHQFESDSNSIDYGDELDLAVNRKFNKHLSAGLKFADYSAGDVASGKVDTTKMWLFGQFSW